VNVMIVKKKKILSTVVLIVVCLFVRSAWMNMQRVEKMDAVNVQIIINKSHTHRRLQQGIWV